MQTAEPEVISVTAPPSVRSFSPAIAPADGMEAIQEANRLIPMPPLPEVPLSELEGLPIFEQFLKVWGTPERGAILWEMWLAGSNDFTRQMLQQLAQSTAEELNVPLPEAQRRLAVDKVLSDVGPEYAVKFLESYKAVSFTQSKPLKPMVVRPKRKR